MHADISPRLNPSPAQNANVGSHGGVWMIAERGIHHVDGYWTRVRLALDVMSEVLSKPILFYPSESKDEDLSSLLDVAIPIGIPIAPRQPMPFMRHVFREALECHLKSLGRPALVYGQNLAASNLALSFSKSHSIPLVFDYHGVAVPEIIASDKSLRAFVKAAIYLMLERRLAKHADKIVVVSSNFQRWIERRYRRGPADVHVFPMLPSASLQNAPQMDRAEIASELGVDVKATTVVFSYLGQAQNWQMAAETIAFYARTEVKNDDTFLLIISNAPDRFLEVVRQAGVKRYKIISVPHTEVSRYLDFCDFGFVFRRPILINSVASPTKVMEYLSRGVLPVMTESVGDFSQELSSKHLATIVPYDVLMRLDGVDRTWARPPANLKESARRYATSFRRTHKVEYAAFLRGLIGSVGAKSTSL